MPTISTLLVPTQRNPRFELPPKRARDWHVQGSHVTHFFNALSLQFPEGERFLINAVRHYREHIADAVLKQQVRGFIGQEAAHTREHVEYNKLLSAHGIPGQGTRARLGKLFAFYRRKLSPTTQLAITLAIEHHTAMLAHWFLSHADLATGSVEPYRQVWTWHALEETEHKAVAFDVWKSVTRPGARRYLMRVAIYVITSLAIWGCQWLLHTELLLADRRNSERHLRGLWRTLKLLFAPRRGIFPCCFSEFVSYLRPNFHPWDHDNRHFLRLMDEFAEGGSTDSIVASSRAHRVR